MIVKILPNRDNQIGILMPASVAAEDESCIVPQIPHRQQTKK